MNKFKILLLLLFLYVSLPAQSYFTNHIVIFKKILVNGETDWEQKGSLLERNTFDINDDGYLYWWRKDEKYRFRITHKSILKTGALAVEIIDIDKQYNVVFFKKNEITMPYRNKFGEDLIIVFEIVDEY